MSKKRKWVAYGIVVGTTKLGTFTADRKDVKTIAEGLVEDPELCDQCMNKVDGLEIHEVSVQPVSGKGKCINFLAYDERR